MLEMTNQPAELVARSKMDRKRKNFKLPTPGNEIIVVLSV